MPLLDATNHDANSYIQSMQQVFMNHGIEKEILQKIDYAIFLQMVQLLILVRKD